MNLTMTMNETMVLYALVCRREADISADEAAGAGGFVCGAGLHIERWMLYPELVSLTPNAFCREHSANFLP